MSTSAANPTRQTPEQVRARISHAQAMTRVENMRRAIAQAEQDGRDTRDMRRQVETMKAEADVALEISTGATT